MRYPRKKNRSEAMLSLIAIILAGHIITWLAGFGVASFATSNPTEAALFGCFVAGTFTILCLGAVVFVLATE